MTEAAIIEWFFVVWTVLGATFGLLNLWDALTTRRIVRASRLNAGRQFLAVDDVRREFLRLCAQGLLLLIAGVALWTPNRIATRTALGWVLLIAFLLIPALLAGNSLLDFLGRRKLRRYYAPHERR